MAIDATLYPRDVLTVKTLLYTAHGLPAQLISLLSPMLSAEKNATCGAPQPMRQKLSRDLWPDILFASSSAEFQPQRSAGADAARTGGGHRAAAGGPASADLLARSSLAQDPHRRGRRRHSLKPLVVGASTVYSNTAAVPHNLTNSFSSGTPHAPGVWW